jgi:hypothetical protein
MPREKATYLIAALNEPSGDVCSIATYEQVTELLEKCYCNYYLEAA